MSLLQQTLDCRGLQCPEPILQLAKAARQLPGGKLLVHADDAAFPLDLRSWCKSSGAELVRLDETSSGFSAELRLAHRAVPSRAPNFATSTTKPVTEPEQLVDCRGKQCPEPIMDLARAARTARGPLRILATDPAFVLDLRAWCKTSGAIISSIETSEDGQVTAVVIPKSVEATRKPASATPTGGAPSTLSVVTLDSTKSAASPQLVRATPDADLQLDFSSIRDKAQLLTRLSALSLSGAGLTASLKVADQELGQTVLRWSAESGHSLTSFTGTQPVELMLTLAAAAPAAQTGALALATEEAEADCALLVLHNDLEALLAAMLIANGAAAQGLKVVVFFTFWGLNLLRGDNPASALQTEKVSFIQRVFKWFMPKGPRRQQLGQLNFGGAGPILLKGLMRKQNLTDLPRLVQQAEEQGVQFVACTMSMSVMGITKGDLAPYSNLAFGGVSYFVGAARGAKMSLVF